MPPPSPRHALAGDVDAAVRVLTRAFHDDPIMRWLFPDDPTRADDLAVLFGTCTAAARRRGHTYVVGLQNGAISAAALWGPPDVEVMSGEEAGAIGPLVGDRYGDEGLARMGSFAEVMGAHHPEAPHFYLWIVGVDPDAQGTGLGAHLLAPVLARCDSDGMPAYLESTNPRNVPFYARLGFDVHSEFRPDGGPLLTGMWRAPR
jgi:GNAT superfamily N-acetyltransferase